MTGIYTFILRLTDVVFSVIALMLTLRVILRLLAANPQTPFVTWVYSASDGLISPFRGMFPNLALSNTAFFDIVAVVSLVVYAVLFYLLRSLVDAALSAETTDRRTHLTDVHTHAR
ncbi:MAG: YggT family protein [Candidatus Levybacteria bacterium]|nr:YggT family protein [Candidatus Levybacteria bacterium]